VLLNTSFNLHGSPIVRGPAEALAVFRESGLEFLALGQYVVAKRARIVLREAPAAALRAAG
jgi:carbamoyltransferase